MMYMFLVKSSTPVMCGVFTIGTMTSATLVSLFSCCMPVTPTKFFNLCSSICRITAFTTDKINWTVCLCMIPKLFVYKRRGGRTKRQIGRIVFAVVDDSKSCSYPSNFLCVFPANKQFADANSKFGRIFGENRFSVAQELLIEALKQQEDPSILRLIRQRLEKF